MVGIASAVDVAALIDDTVRRAGRPLTPERCGLLTLAALLMP